ncbi:helix-turn-helix transcriptional regulator [Micromonospora sp. CPCC 205371]|nr:helix-turn-helix transcriptional regulator [Micromonospora sp. CPCC 205371]
MRKLRDDRGLTLKYVAGYLGVEFSTLARYERAEWPFRRDHVAALLDMYGVYDDREREALVALSANAGRANHWYLDGVEPEAKLGPMPDRWWIHDRAEEICFYSPTVLPEVVQTTAYLDEVMASVRPHKPPSPGERSKRAHDISVRAKALTSREGPRLRIVVDEAVLRRPVAGRAALKAQLEHLVNLLRMHPTVDLQVLPEKATAHPGLYGGFTIYRMPQPYPEVVFVEHLGGALLIETDGAEEYSKAFNHLAMEVADSPTDSIALLNQVRERL